MAEQVFDYPEKPRVSLDAAIIACAQLLIAGIRVDAVEVATYRKWMADSTAMHLKGCPCGLTYALSAMRELAWYSFQYEMQCAQQEHDRRAIRH